MFWHNLLVDLRWWLVRKLILSDSVLGSLPLEIMEDHGV